MVLEALRVQQGYVSPQGLEQLTRALADHLTVMTETLGRIVPPRLEYVTFPNDGGYEPMPAGVTILDFTTGYVTSPDKKRLLSRDVLSLKDLQSALLFVDSYVTVTVEPGVGSFAVNVATPVFGTGKKVTRITLDASWPYLLTLIAGTYISPPGVGFQNNGLMRVSDTTLTKTAALGTADSFGSIKFVPRWGTKTLDQTLYGVAGFFTGGAVQKFFIVRNLSVATVEVRVQGGIQPTLVEGLEQLGLPGYVQDPDIHPAGSATENFVSIAAGGQAILETGLPYGIIRMQARVAAAMPAALTARLVIEFAGITTAGR